MQNLQVTEAELSLLTRLSARVVSFPLAQFEEAIESVLGELAERLEAINGYWLLATRDERVKGVDGWSVKAFHYLKPSEAKLESVQRERERIAAGNPNRMTRLYMSRAGEDRAVRPVDLMPRHEWESDIFYREHYEPNGISDVVTAACVVHPRAEVTLGLHRGGGARFTEKERDLMLMAAVVLRRPMRAMVLTGGWLQGEGALTPREREVLDGVLSGSSEKEIASTLGIAERTVHQHTGRLYRKLGVRGRAGLLALWSGREEPE